MTRKERRFDFLDNLQTEGHTPPNTPGTATSETTGNGQLMESVQESIDPALPATTARIPAQESARPYLYEPMNRNEAQAPLGNRVRLTAKHELEDYVRALKRAGHPATEGRVLEALMLLLKDHAIQAQVNSFLTGREQLQD
ncbi:hypothetical protein [Deinococcus marmoris]|uniref:hypothetical protein n=1 Tax=Deinococcus marmoris TaxID=249408 RepID=UPI0004972539|nr:hypothetical protein [Deinococcus marmoris]